MANIKFSQFTAEADIANFDDIVGYQGAVNKRITPANLASSLEPLIGPYLPLTAGVTVPLTGDLYIGDGSAATSNVIFQTTGLAGNTVEITSQGQQFLLHEFGADMRIGPNDDVIIDDTGAGGVTLISPTTFTNDAVFSADVLDITNSTGNSGFILKSNGGGGSGVSWRQEQPGCQIKIVGTSGLANTNNGTDFLVPYNTVIVNDDPTIFNPVVTGGFGNQGAIQVLQSGRYEFFARYSSFDLIQPALPNVDGTKFFRITAATDVASGGIGTKQCILQDLIVATSTNGEANVTGGGFMDLNAGDYFKIIGFHTGATGGTGTQGFPVSSNAFFNEPMLWLVKIQ